MASKNGDKIGEHISSGARKCDLDWEKLEKLENSATNVPPTSSYIETPCNKCASYIEPT